MTGAAIGAALFVLGLAWTFREPRLTGRLWGLGAMALGSLVVVGSSAAPGRLGTTVAMALTVVPMLAAAGWLQRRLERDRAGATSLDEQPR
jgi:hypothetical protein